MASLMPASRHRRRHDDERENFLADFALRIKRFYADAEFFSRVAFAFS